MKGEGLANHGSAISTVDMSCKIMGVTVSGWKFVAPLSYESCPKPQVRNPKSLNPQH